jgi:hypothetical protein
MYFFFIDQWRFIDSVYFTVVTITTVGYGDIKPTASDSKIFTGFYIILGVGKRNSKSNDKYNEDFFLRYYNTNDHHIRDLYF